MTREKKKWSCQKLEDHIVIWATDRLDELHEVTDKIYLDQSILDEEKDFIYSGLADQIFHLLELINPFDHDYEVLIQWAQDFVDEYAKYDNKQYES